MVLPVDFEGVIPKDDKDIFLSGTFEADSKGDEAVEPIIIPEAVSDSFKVVGLGSPKSPKSLKERQQSRKAKYDRWRCNNCKKPFKQKAHPLPKKVILKLRETFDKYSRATWRKVERQLLTYSNDEAKLEESDGVIDHHSDAHPYITKTLNTYKTPTEMRSGLQEHFSELLFPGALFRGESVKVPWASLGQWLEINQKRLVNWPTGVKFPDSSYQMMGFWNLTEVNALYGVKIVNWSSREKNLSGPGTPLVFNQMGQTVVNVSQIEELTYGISSVDSSTDFLSDSDIDVKERLSRNGAERKRLAIRALGSNS